MVICKTADVKAARKAHRGEHVLDIETRMLHLPRGGEPIEVTEARVKYALADPRTIQYPPPKEKKKKKKANASS